ncbi:hypothetical protein CTAYLR_003272 [Chrysophaeum taylorii]|uniref:Uncharacterized protein n=1 Tax=Chrysophaeum taylorii TaxID=2483200 RepID=A0AAD7XJ26_9STRA|nr:hypothetical protein CTAYLR_003272 [Chrysophaeum taylorii]
MAVAAVRAVARWTLGVDVACERVEVRGVSSVVAFGIECREEAGVVRAERVEVKVLILGLVGRLFLLLSRPVISVRASEILVETAEEDALNRVRSLLRGASRFGRYARIEVRSASIGPRPSSVREGVRRSLQIEGIVLEAAENKIHEEHYDVVFRGLLSRSERSALKRARWTWEAADGSFASVGVHEDNELAVGVAVRGAGWREAAAAAAADSSHRGGVFSHKFPRARLEMMMTTTTGFDEPWTVVASAQSVEMSGPSFECARLEAKASRGRACSEANLSSFRATYEATDDEIRCVGEGEAALRIQWERSCESSTIPLAPAIKVDLGETTVIWGGREARLNAVLADVSASWDPRPGRVDDPFADRREGCVVAKVRSSRAHASRGDEIFEMTGIKVAFETAAAVARKFSVEPDEANLAIARAALEIACGEVRAYRHHEEGHTARRLLERHRRHPTDDFRESRRNDLDLDAAIEFGLRRASFLEECAGLETTFRCARLDCFGVIHAGAFVARHFDDDVWPRARWVADAFDDRGRRLSIRVSRLLGPGLAAARRRNSYARYDGDAGVLDGAPSLTLDARLARTSRVSSDAAARWLECACKRLERGPLSRDSYRFTVRWDLLQVVSHRHVVRHHHGLTPTTPTSRWRRARAKIVAVARFALRRRRSVAASPRVVAVLSSPATLELQAAALEVIDDEGTAVLRVDDLARCRFEDVSERRVDGRARGARLDVAGLRRDGPWVTGALAETLDSRFKAWTWTLEDTRITISPRLEARVESLGLVFASDETSSASWTATNLDVSAEHRQLISLRSATLTTEAVGPLRRTRVRTSTARLSVTRPDVPHLAEALRDAVGDALVAPGGAALQILVARAHVRLLGAGRYLELGGSRFLCQIRRVDANYDLAFSTRALALVDLISSRVISAAGNAHALAHRDAPSDEEDDEEDEVLTATCSFSDDRCDDETRVDPSFLSCLEALKAHWSPTLLEDLNGHHHRFSSSSSPNNKPPPPPVTNTG